MEPTAKHSLVKTSRVGLEHVVEQINGLIEFGNDVYVPTNGLFVGQWNGYPYGNADLVANVPKGVMRHADGWSDIFHVLPAGRRPPILRTIALEGPEIARITGTLLDLGLRVFKQRSHSVETDRVPYAVEPYGLSNLVSRVDDYGKGARIRFVGDREPLLLIQPDQFVVTQTLSP